MTASVQCEAATEEDDFENGGENPRQEMGEVWGGFLIQQRDEEKAVDEEGSYKVDLERGQLGVCWRRVGRLTTTAWPHHHCSFLLERAWTMTLTELAMNVRAAASETHSKRRFWVGVTSSWAFFLFKLRSGSVAGSGLPPGPSWVEGRILGLELEAVRMLRITKTPRKKASRMMGVAL